MDKTLPDSGRSTLSIINLANELIHWTNTKHPVIELQNALTTPFIKPTSKNDPQPFVIGGGEIYKLTLSIAEKIELTRVHASFDADTFFPKIDPNIWKETSNIFHDKDEKHNYAFSFITYSRL